MDSILRATANGLEDKIRFPLNLKSPPFDVGNYLDRAARAIGRFQNFEPGPATPLAIHRMVDEFFEAAQVTWHLKDQVVHVLERGEDDPAFAKFTRQPRQAALRAIANASKHGQESKPRKSSKPPKKEGFPGAIRLFSPDESAIPLSEFYRHLRLEIEGLAPVHPSDFLQAAWAEWKAFAFKHYDPGREWF